MDLSKNLDRLQKAMSENWCQRSPTNERCWEVEGLSSFTQAAHQQVSSFTESWSKDSRTTRHVESNACRTWTEPKRRLLRWLSHWTRNQTPRSSSGTKTNPDEHSNQSSVTTSPAKSAKKKRERVLSDPDLVFKKWPRRRLDMLVDSCGWNHCKN